MQWPDSVSADESIDQLHPAWEYVENMLDRVWWGYIGYGKVDDDRVDDGQTQTHICRE